MQKAINFLVEQFTISKEELGLISAEPTDGESNIMRSPQRSEAGILLSVVYGGASEEASRSTSSALKDVMNAVRDMKINLSVGI